MSAPPRRPVAPLQTESPSVSGDPDETVAAPASSETAAPGFGPPAVAGEVGCLGPYRIVKELGHGGMGAVYAALDTRLERRLALKVMLPRFAAEPAAKARFLREARAAARVKHDNVVTVYEADERDGVPYIAMEFLEGYPLDEYLKKKGSPSIPQIIRIVAEAAAGLAAAHKFGLVHRDIKPGNLWLEAPNGRVKVLDFGLARPVDAEAELTKSGAIIGTPAYMSPEQARGEKVDHRTDLFSLGALLYRLCTGRLPFEGPNTMAVLMALGTEEPKSVRDLNPAVPEPLAALAHQLLAKQADARPQTADELVKRLRAIAQTLAAPRPVPAPDSASQPSVVYVPIQVTAPPPEANPFGDIDAEATEREPTSVGPKSVRKKPGGKAPWVAAGLAALLLLVAAGVIIVIKNKDGTETKIEVPDGATVTVKDKDGKAVAQVPPLDGKPVAGGDADRRAAEWAISMGAWIRVNGNKPDINSVANLPKGKFTLTHIFLSRKPVSDADLKQLKDLSNLTQLYLPGSQVSDAGLKELKEHKNLAHLNLHATSVGDAGLKDLKELKNLTDLGLQETQVSSAGLKELKELKNLTGLWLDGTQVSDAGLRELKELKNLTVLYLPGTRVSDAGLKELKELNNLSQLNLRDTKVTPAGVEELAKALPGCKIEHDGGVIEPTVVADPDRKAAEWVISVGGYVRTKEMGDGTTYTQSVPLPKDRFTVRVVDLSGRKVTDAGVAALRDCDGLTTLDLNRADGLTDVGLATLKGSKGLTHLGVVQTKVTAKGVADFAAAMPLCKIDHDGGRIEPRADADRTAAEWVLSVGGGGTVVANGQEHGIVAPLPKERFILTKVNLHGTNGVTDAGLAVFKDTKDLIGLDLAHTQVTDAGLAHFRHNTGLTDLSLYGCHAVTDAGFAHFKDCKGLKSLSANNTQLTDAGLAHFKHCKQLISLGVGHTKVTDAGLANFKDCKGWVGFDLVGSEITDAGLVYLTDVTGIRQLTLGSGITDAGLAHFTGCAEIQHLVVNSAKVTDTGFAHFGNCKKLDLLYLNGTGLTDAGLAHFKDCKKLGSVVLESTQVTDATLQMLRTCPELKSLNIRKTKVTAKGVEELSKALPGCKIEHDGGVIEPKK